MNNCYYFELYNYNDGILNTIVDATYIIHLVNNNRLNDIKKKINDIHTSNTLYIVYNKGFRNCKKKDYIISSIYDIIDVNIEIFKHAKINNYNNILILEDDYIFSNEIKNKKNINIIEKFIKNKINFQYYLGCLPVIMYPQDFYNYKLLFGGTAHAVIYSKFNRELILNKNQTEMPDWDVNNVSTYPCYTFYKPLCYQTFPITENQQNWKNIYNYYYYNCIYDCGIYCLKLLKLNIQPEPGFTIIYLFSKLLYLIFIIFIIFLIYNNIKK